MLSRDAFRRSPSMTAFKRLARKLQCHIGPATRAASYFCWISWYFLYPLNFAAAQYTSSSFSNSIEERASAIV